jgi:hypothetical protein
MKLPSFIKALCKLCGSGEGRWNGLAGVKCESQDGVAKLAATDGRMLAVVSYKDDDHVDVRTSEKVGVNVVVPGKELSRAYSAAFAKNGKRGVMLLPAKGEVHVTGAGGSTDIPTGDCVYPRYEEVLPQDASMKGYVSITLDPDLLYKLCDLCSAAQTDTHKGMTLWIKDGESAAYVSGRYAEAGTAYTVRCAIMPLSSDDPKGKATFPVVAAAGGKPAPKRKSSKSVPPELMDDDAVAAAVTREPEPIGSDDLPAVTGSL